MPTKKQNKYEHVTSKLGIWQRLKIAWMALRLKNYYFVGFEINQQKNVTGVILRTFKADEDAVKKLSLYLSDSIDKTQQISAQANNILKTLPPTN